MAGLRPSARRIGCLRGTSRAASAMVVSLAEREQRRMRSWLGTRISPVLAGVEFVSLPSPDPIHEEFLVACLQREVSAREAHGGEGRIRAARFPARKSLEEFDFDHARWLKRDVIAHLGTLDFVAGKENVVFLGPPGTGKTHLAIGLAIRACQAGHRVLFATAAEWVARLAEAHHAGRLQAELTKLGRYPLLVVDLCRPRDYADLRVV